MREAADMGIPPENKLQPKREYARIRLVLPSLGLVQRVDGVYLLAWVNPSTKTVSSKAHFVFNHKPTINEAEDEERYGVLEDLIAKTPDSEKSLHNYTDAISEFEKLDKKLDEWFQKNFGDKRRLIESFNLSLSSALIRESSRIGYNIRTDINFTDWLYNRIAEVAVLMDNDPVRPQSQSKS